jgi:hypothetical protein
MAGGFIQRFKGRIKCSELWLDNGGRLVDAQSGIFAFPHVAQKLAIAVGAVAASYFTASLPAGAVITGITVYTSTAFTGTGVTFQAGVSQGDATYVAPASIKAAGVVKATLASAALAAMPAGSPNLFIEIAQSGTPTAVGAALVLIEYFTL